MLPNEAMKLLIERFGIHRLYWTLKDLQTALQVYFAFSLRQDLRDLCNLLHKLDKALKQQAGNCEKCGKPRGGFIPASILAQCGGNLWLAKKRLGLCTCREDQDLVGESGD